MRVTENKCNCAHLILPITDYPEYSTLYNPTWEDSGVLTMIYRINLDGSTTIVDIDLSLHVVDGFPLREVYDLPSIQDGWYKIRSYILPTKEFLESLGMVDGYNDLEYLEFWKNENLDNMFNENHYITIGIDKEGICYLGRYAQKVPTFGSNYHWLNADLIDVIDEFNSRGIMNGYVYGTNVRVMEENFFSTCHLYKCFINNSQSVLNQYNSCGSGICSNSKNTKCKSDIDESTIQIRDYLWMTINAIKYAIECGDYQIANKLLDCISTCSGICNDITYNDCGCGQYKEMNTTKAAIPVEAYELAISFNFNDYYNKLQVLNLLNNKLDKLIAGIDMNITENNVINNQHTFLSNNDINNLWNGL